MIYIFAIILGLVSSILLMACEVSRGNITHLKNGREPNAGAAIFPTIIIVPLFFAGIAMGIKSFFLAHDLVIFLGVTLALIVAIGISLLRLNAKLKSLKKS